MSNPCPVIFVRPGSKMIVSIFPGLLDAQQDQLSRLLARESLNGVHDLTHVGECIFFRNIGYVIAIIGLPTTPTSDGCLYIPPPCNKVGMVFEQAKMLKKVFGGGMMATICHFAAGQWVAAHTLPLFDVLASPSPAESPPTTTTTTTRRHRCGQFPSPPPKLLANLESSSFVSPTPDPT